MSPRSLRSATRSVITTALISAPTLCGAQLQAGVYDFGLGRQGEKRGNWTPGEWLAAVLLMMTVFLGLAVSLGFCYYVAKRSNRRALGKLQRDQSQRRSQLSEFVLVPGDNIKYNDNTLVGQN